jgi:hypothetical protein
MRKWFLGPKNKVRNKFSQNGLIWVSKDLKIDADTKNVNLSSWANAPKMFLFKNTFQEKYKSL